MNIIFVEPSFPYNQGEFVRGLHEAGANVIGIGERPKEYLSDEVNYSANNLKNLFEVPVLYYGLCLYLFVTGNVDLAYVVAAWLFFLFRAFHSVVHCTKNIVMLRFYLYSGAALSLWFMLGKALIGELAVYF